MSGANYDSLKPINDDMHKMLAASVHIGTKNCNFQMEPYVWKRRADGINLINLGMTYEKLVLAARIIVTIENPQDVVVLSSRPYGQRAVLKFAHYTGAQAIAGRYTPGTFTNQIQKKYMEPRLLICTDPRTDNQPIIEASYVNIPVITFADTDSPMRGVTLAIPGNNKAKLSIGLLWWLLTREVLRLRGTIARTSPWNVAVDLFIYTSEEDREQQENAAAAAKATPAAIAASAGWGDATDAGVANWGDSAQATGEWGATAEAGAGGDSWGDQAAGGNWGDSKAPAATGSW